MHDLCYIGVGSGGAGGAPGPPNKNQGGPGLYLGPPVFERVNFLINTKKIQICILCQVPFRDKCKLEGHVTRGPSKDHFAIEIR